LISSLWQLFGISGVLAIFASTSFSDGIEHIAFTMRLCSNLFLFTFVTACSAFSSVNPVATSNAIATQNNILILDHLNINHQKGRHDWLKAFYVDFLQCALDPRKKENVLSGKNTIWANIGAQQFHLSEGKPDAQVLDGVVTLVYPDLSSFTERYQSAQQSLQGSLFEMKEIEKGSLVVVVVVDPWGSKFQLVQGKPAERDNRGSQPGDCSEGFSMRDLTIHTPPNSNLQGIGRFYEQVLLGAVVADCSDDCIQIQVGPRQTLTFQNNPSTTVESHVDLRDEEVEVPEGAPHFLSNYGLHVSMYVADLPSAYKQVKNLGLAYVNPRFKRRAYTLDEAIDDCMFRCLDIVDPENVEDGPILKLEHEVRSVIKRDGSKYKSCPFDNIPEGCVSQ
jgi:hypothetical protein